MFAFERPIIDPTIPGLSVRDLQARAIPASEGATDHGRRHRAFVIHHDLARLSRRALRDLGLDRDAA